MGRGMVAALALGPSGSFSEPGSWRPAIPWLPSSGRKSLLERAATHTTVTDAFSGLWLRTLRNAYTTGYQASGAPVLPPLLQNAAAQDVVEEARRRGDGDYFPMLAGQGVGLVRDLPGAAEVVEAVVREARIVLAGLPRRARTA